MRYYQTNTLNQSLIPKVPTNKDSSAKVAYNYRRQRNQIILLPSRIKNNSFKEILKQIYELQAKQKQVQQIIQKELDNLKPCLTNLAFDNQKDLETQQSSEFKNFIDDKWESEKAIYDSHSLLKVCTYQTDIPEFVQKEISKDQQQRFRLLYQGTKDGLTNSSYWQKCDQQSNLLTIITLENGNIFGGYSPCLLNSEQANWVSDPTNSSFVFQQNKKEIYKLKNSQQAIYCYKDNCPNFGSDLHISNDFKSLGSDLGYMYDITPYNVDNIKTHLVGDKDRKIVECKVYQTIEI